jgi:peptidyl-prolyl cis-trans isomerase B (cyclophilin B)
MKKLISIFAVLLMVVSMTAIFAACGEKKEEAPVTETTTTETTTETKTEETATETKEEPKAEDKVEEPAVSTEDFVKTIVFETNYGNIEFGLYADTPIATQNMIDKVNAGFYNNLTFHRVAKNPDGSNFVIQGGDPQGTGMGGGQMGVDPIGDHSNLKGTIAMASSSRAQPITDQSDAQFFFNTNDNTFLDGYGFIAFGVVTSGYDVCEKIQNVPCGPGGDGSNSSPIEPVVITKAYVK